MPFRLRPALPLFLLLLGGNPAVHGANAAERFVIRDVRLFDGIDVFEHRTVVVEGGRIARIGAASLEAEGSEIDGRGHTLLPGLFDCHVHINDDPQAALQQTLAFGVTTALDMFSSGERQKRILAAEREDAAGVAAVRTAGTGITNPGGHPTEMGGPPIPTLARAEESQAFVDARIAEGSDFIKVIYDDMHMLGPNRTVPKMPFETLEAVVAAAHQRGKLVVAHVTTEEDARAAIQAGVDGLAHLFAGATTSPDFGTFAARHHVFVIPTLSTIYGFCGRLGGRELLADERLAPYIAPSLRNLLTMNWGSNQSCAGTDAALRQLHAAGVPILAGTDAPLPGSTYGASLHGELALLVHDGLTPREALASATSVPAKAFRFTDRGRILPGKRADLVLVDGDPTQDITATRNIIRIWKAGVPVQRKTY